MNENLKNMSNEELLNLAHMLGKSIHHHELLRRLSKSEKAVKFMDKICKIGVTVNITKIIRDYLDED